MAIGRPGRGRLSGCARPRGCLARRAHGRPCSRMGVSGGPPARSATWAGSPGGCRGGHPADPTAARAAGRSGRRGCHFHHRLRRTPRRGVWQSETGKVRAPPLVGPATPSPCAARVGGQRAAGGPPRWPAGAPSPRIGGVQGRISPPGRESLERVPVLRVPGPGPAALGPAAAGAAQTLLTGADQRDPLREHVPFGPCPAGVQPRAAAGVGGRPRPRLARRPGRVVGLPPPRPRPWARPPFSPNSVWGRRAVPSGRTWSWSPATCAPGTASCVRTGESP